MGANLGGEVEVDVVLTQPPPLSSEKKAGRSFCYSAAFRYPFLSETGV